jgi:hypothetical protein
VIKLRNTFRRWRRDPMIRIVAGLIVGNVLLLGMLFLVMMR